MRTPHLLFLLPGKDNMEDICGFKTWKEFETGTELLPELRPFPNEHAARLTDPDKYAEFRRQNNKFGPGIHAIFGIIKKPKRKSELQSIRFDSKKFTAAQAKKWLKDHDYKPILFEEATGKKTAGQKGGLKVLGGLETTGIKVVPAGGGTPVDVKVLAKKGPPPSCPRCGSSNTHYKEVHPDTSMNDIILACRDCGWDEESVDRDANIIQASFNEFEVCAFDKNTPLPIQIQEPTDSERVVRFRASDDTLDRYEEVIVAEGWDLTEFIRNPVVMQFHDHHSWPIGTAVAAGIVKGGLFIDSEFDPPEVDESADLVFRKIKYGTVRTGSVGFIPIAWISRMDNKLHGNPKNKIDVDAMLAKYPKARRIFLEQELLEWTICPIPANPNALAASLKKIYAKRFGLEPMTNAGAAQGAMTIPEAALTKCDSINAILTESKA